MLVCFTFLPFFPPIAFADFFLQGLIFYVFRVFSLLFYGGVSDNALKGIRKREKRIYSIISLLFDGRVERDTSDKKTKVSY